MEKLKQRGLTLVELMISLTLGLLLLIGIGSLFVYTSRSSSQNDLLASMQDQGRFALSALTRDLSMAGYWGDVYGSFNLVPNLADEDTANDSSSATTALPPAQDCGPDTTTAWSFQLSRRLEFRNHDASGTAASSWRCIGHAQSGTDAVAIRRVAGQQTGEMASSDATVQLRPRHYYLQVNEVVGTLVRWGSAADAAPDATAVPLSPPMRFYRFEPRIYFVRDYARTPGDGIPTLCRKQLCPSGYVQGDGAETAACGGGSAAASGYYSECLAEGVEDLQITWGLDTNGDYAVDAYTSTPTSDQLGMQALTAQVELLLRSVEADAQYTDEKTYQLGDRSAHAAATRSTAQARYYRRMYSTTVLLHNRVP